eukprot:3058197-Prymnesium_polylepis.1
MADAISVQVTSHSYDDVYLAYAATKVGVPYTYTYALYTCIHVHVHVHVHAQTCGQGGRDTRVRDERDQISLQSEPRRGEDAARAVSSARQVRQLIRTGALTSA